MAVNLTAWMLSSYTRAKSIVGDNHLRASGLSWASRMWLALSSDAVVQGVSGWWICYPLRRV
jgi:hypothetical protein